MLKNLLTGIILLMLSQVSFAGLTSPTGTELVGESATFSWTADADQYWLRVYDDGEIIFDSGRLNSNTSQTVAMPADGSTIGAIFYRKVAGSWSSETTEWVSIADEKPPVRSSQYKLVSNQCLIGPDEIDPTIPGLPLVACGAECPAGYIAISGEASAVIQPGGLTGIDGREQVTFGFGTNGLGTPAMRLILSSPPDIEFFHPRPEEGFEEPLFSGGSYDIEVSVLCGKN